MIDIPSIVYNAVRDAQGLKHAFWSAVRESLVSIAGDPVCRQSVHGRTLLLPLSHQLPLFLTRHPFYDSLPTRMANYVRERDGHVTCIDVGANVGDTVAAFFAGSPTAKTALAIEPNEKFRAFLLSNWGSDPRVTVVPFACSAISGSEVGSFLERGGTASIVPYESGQSSSGATKIEQRTLDEIVSAYPLPTPFNLLKVDTDGHDLDVLEGARKAIECARPLILFECEAYGEPKFVERTIECLQSLRRAGYGSVLLYDNYGTLAGRRTLSDIRGLAEALFYMLMGGCTYYDLLVLEDEDAEAFQGREHEFFEAAMPRPHLRATARYASMLSRGHQAAAE